MKPLSEMTEEEIADLLAQEDLDWYARQWAVKEAVDELRGVYPSER